MVRIETSVVREYTNDEHLSMHLRILLQSSSLGIPRMSFITTFLTLPFRILCRENWWMIVRKPIFDQKLLHSIPVPALVHCSLA